MQIYSALSCLFGMCIYVTILKNRPIGMTTIKNCQLSFRLIFTGSSSRVKIISIERVGLLKVFEVRLAISAKIQNMFFNVCILSFAKFLIRIYFELLQCNHVDPKLTIGKFY